MRDTVPAPLELDLATAERLTGGSWRGPRAPVVCRGAAIDSRLVRPGCIFACLPGSRVDGHDYAATAVGDGASLVLASRPVEVPAPVLLVADVTAALAALAAELRRRLAQVVWIAITGSNGKTTVKELVLAAASGSGPVHATCGSLNNHLGVPLTILATPADSMIAVIELGASAAGEIDALAALVRPQVAVITSIGPAHLAGFGGLAGVAAAKAEIFRHVQAGGRMLFCRHGLEEACRGQGVEAQELLATLRAAAGDGNLTVVGDAGCAIDGATGPQGIVLRTPLGEVGIGLVGTHNLANACLAWHICLAAGLDGKRALAGLASARPATGRLQVRRLAEHRLLDDSYNANPASMAAGLGVLARESGARIAVLGAMGELGPDSEAMHRGVGAEAARLGLPLLTVGEAAQGIGLGYREAGGRDHVQVTDCAEAVTHLRERLRAGPTAVLVKASRSAGLEAVAEGLAASLGYAAGVEDEGRPC